MTILLDLSIKKILLKSLQPNVDTRKKQLDAWCSLVLAYFKHNKAYTLDVSESQSTPLFHNDKINRKLSLDFINNILEELRTRGNIEWTDKTRKQCLLMWRTPDEWGKLVYRWAHSNGLVNTVCTLYELSHGDQTKAEEFHGLDDWLLKRALQTLEKQRKAELISFDGNEGVKFF
ncbi:hypothetical protein NP493_1285g00052 [Ridgeia piscesae]|uniref:Vacuolar protein-sorting-associated protein 25 n=1 Tax=Ridgeia piscesae TaxID=27915 RepID=A0AAD9K9J6_RIDPI|nr:hypothetical protein NP493_1285g00052 [Ridgeia piscesae]